MSRISRFANLFRRKRLDRELEEELASHMEEAVEQGRPAEEARRAFGGALQYREQSRDLKLMPWLDALAGDVVFGWRQLNKHRAVSLAAILSLALAMGATTAVYRLIDAVMLRTLPVAEPERLWYLTETFIDRNGAPAVRYWEDYKTFKTYSALVADRADVMALGIAFRPGDITIGNETIRGYREYVSGNVFAIFGLRPALGRLITTDDDRTPAGSPVAVLSYDFWSRHFARNPNVLGTEIRMGKDRLQVIGVTPEGFIGTEPGDIPDIFVPATMNVDALDHGGWSWLRIWVKPKPGFSAEQVRQPLQAAYTRQHQERAAGFHSDTPREFIDRYLKESLVLQPAAAGASALREDYRRPLLILSVLVALVLLIACVNVGNLLSAQATARGREMALRVSIGAGQWRLMQLVLVESTMLALIASALGAAFAAWSAPLVVGMLTTGDPVRLVLSSGVRDIGFGFALALAVTVIFGIAPALRASRVKPMAAIRGSDDPRSRHRFMNAMLAAQVAFCILVQFVAGLFVSTFQRLYNRPIGFAAEGLLSVYANAPRELTPQTWMQVAGELEEIPGVRSVAVAGWPLLSRDRWTVTVRLPGRPVEPRTPSALEVSPGFFRTMRIGMVDGREFRLGDLPPRLDKAGKPLPGVGIVNESFARIYFDGRNPVGQTIEVRQRKDVSATMEIVGYVRDTIYAELRDTLPPVLYVPMTDNAHPTVVVRADTESDALALAPAVRRKFSQARPDFQIGTIQPHTAFLRWQTLREHLLAVLSVFFAVVGLVLSAIGLYGVLNYSVTRQRKEIGIRMALGARPADVVERVASGLLRIVIAGLLVGLAAGIGCGRFVESLLYEVKATDASALAGPMFALLAAAIVAAVPPAVRAVRIDPARTLRSE